MDGPIRALEFYSGIGGLHLALTRSLVAGRVVRAFDWDQSACQVYDANYGPNIVQKIDIATLTASELAGMRAALWLLSPSCQPYTVLNPNAKGAADPRAKSFIHLIEDVLPELVASGQQPNYMLVENVAGFETSSTRQQLLHTLESLGYATLELLLTPLQFGIPNSRLRYYLLAKRKPLRFSRVDDASTKIWRHIPGCGTDWSDRRGQVDVNDDDAAAEIREYLTEDDQAHKCAIPARVLEKWGRLFDIILPSARRSCCFTRGYTKMAERAGSILQMNEQLDTTIVFDKFLAAQAAGDENAVQILAPLRLRYFSPTELLRIFCFESPPNEPSSFVWPPGVSTKTQYKLIGNSVNVRVVTELINYLFERYSTGRWSILRACLSRATWEQRACRGERSHNLRFIDSANSTPTMQVEAHKLTSAENLKHERSLSLRTRITYRARRVRVRSVRKARGMHGMQIRAW